VDEAEDLLQSFFAKLIESGFLDSADPSKGRFRNFLLLALKRSVANDVRQSKAQKRGGQVNFQSVEQLGTSLDRIAVWSSPAPDQLYHRKWALELLNRSVDDVERKYRDTNRSQVFRALHGALAVNHEAFDSATAARELGVTPGNLRIMVYRLREEFRAAVRKRVLETVADPADLEFELRELSAAIATGCNDSFVGGNLYTGN
jgi:RNA polymerase sigma-70 factor (ECF subfamily)